MLPWCREYYKLAHSGLKKIHNMWLFFGDNQSFRIFDPKTWVRIDRREIFCQEFPGGSTYSYLTFPSLFYVYIKATRSLKTSVAFFQWRTKMEKAIDIHNYENDFKTVMVKMHSSDISAKNKNLIEKIRKFLLCQQHRKTSSH